MIKDVFKALKIGLILLLSIAIIGHYNDTAKAQSTRIIIDNMVQDFMKDLILPGVAIQEIGSWVSGTNYKDPVVFDETKMSDHDMEVVMPPLKINMKDSKEEIKRKQDNYKKEAVGVWKRTREYFIEQIKAKFPDDQKLQQKILNSVTIYPPEILVRDVSNLDDAKKLFADLGCTPNLGSMGVEGYFGKLEKAFRQDYKTKKGVTVYGHIKEDGTVKVIKSDTYLEQWLEGFGQYTPDGISVTVKDSLDHLNTANDATKIKKYLTTMDNSLEKGKTLVRITHDNYIKDVIKELVNIQPSDQIPAELMNKINHVSKLANFESDLLAIHSKVTKPQHLDILLAVLDNNSTKWSRLRTKLRALAQSNENICTEAIFTAIFNSFDQLTFNYIASQSGDKSSALNTLLIKNLTTAGIAKQTAVEIANCISETTGGYQATTTCEDCENLMAGICENGNIIDPKAELTMDQIINDMQPITVQDVEQIIRKRLIIIATLCGPNLLLEQLADLKTSYINKCLPKLTALWHQKRMDLMGQVANTLPSFVGAIKSGTMRLGADKNPALIPAGENKEVIVDVIGNDNVDSKEIGEQFDKMDKIITLLKGHDGKAYISVEKVYTWLLDGKSISTDTAVYTNSSSEFFDIDKAKKDFKFTKPGKYQVELRVETKIKFVSQLPDTKYDPIRETRDMLNLDQTVTKSQVIDITVEEDVPKGEVKIIGPDKVNKGEQFTLKAEITEALKKAPNIFINWYVGSKTDPTPKYEGPEIQITASPDKEKETYLVEITNTSKQFIEAYSPKNGGSAKPVPKYDIFASSVKEVQFTSKDFSNDAEKAYKEKNWKKLLELLGNAETQEAKTPIKAYISKLLADIMAENQAHLTRLKEFKVANDAAYNNVKEEIQSKYKAELEKCVADAKAEKKDTRFCEMAFVTPDDKKCQNINAEKYFKPNEWAEKDIKFFEDLIKKGSNLAPGGQISESHFAGIDAYTSFANNAGNKNLLIDFFNENDNKALKINYEFGKPIPVVKYDATCSGSNSGENQNSKKIIIKTTNKTPKIGDAVTVSATVEGMKKGSPNTHFCTSNFDYVWDGDNLFNPVTKSDPNTTNSIDFIPSKIGTYPIEVKVLCKGTAVGSATMNMTVKGSVNGIITGVDNEVVFGTRKDLTATINMTDSSGNITQAPEGQFNLLWNSSPNLEYQAQETTLPHTSVTFNRVSNPTRIWAEIRQNKNGLNEIVGSTETLDLEVISPKFIFKYDPQPNQIKIGQPVKVTLVTEPEVSLNSMDIRWVEPTDRKEIDKGIIEIIPKDTNPIKLHAIARVPVYGDTINDNIKDTLSPSSVKVVATVTGPKYNKAVEIFNAKTGTTETTTAYAVHQDILITADVPGMDNSKLNFEWSAITPDTHIGAGQFCSEVTVNRSQVGTATVKVVASDKDKRILGETTASFDVSVSQDDIDKAKTKGLNPQQILEQALKLIKEGKLDEGIKLLEDTKKQITDNTEINNAYDRYSKEKELVLKYIEKMKTYISENLFDKAEQELLEAKKLHSLYQPVIDAEIFLKAAKEKYNNAQAAKTIDEAKKLDEQGKLDEAITYLADGLKSYPDSSSIKELYEKFRSEKEQIVSNVKQFNQKLATASTPSDYDEAEKYLDVINSLNHPNYQPVIGANNLWGSRFTYRVQLIYHNLDKAKELVSAGKVDEAIVLLEETLISAKKFSKTPKVAQDVQTYLDKVRSDKAICLQQIEKVKALVSQNNMNEAKTELAVAQGIYPNYPPVIEAAKLIKNPVVIQNNPQQNQNNSVVPLLPNTLSGNNFNNPNTNAGQILTHPGRPAIISNNPAASSAGQQLNHPGRPAIISNNPAASSAGQQLNHPGRPAIISNNPNPTTTGQQLTDPGRPALTNSSVSPNYGQSQVEPGRPAFTNLAASPNYTQPQVEPGRPAFTNPAAASSYGQPQVEPGRPAFTNPASLPNYGQQLNHPGRPAILNNSNMISPQQNMMLSLLEQCKYQYQQGNYQAALQKCNDLLVIYPNSGAKKIVSEIQTKMNPVNTPVASHNTSNTNYQTSSNIKKPNQVIGMQNPNTIRPSKVPQTMPVMTTNPAVIPAAPTLATHASPAYTQASSAVHAPILPTIDGNYVGTFNELPGSQLTFTVKGSTVSGRVSGNYQGDNFSTAWSCSINPKTGVFEAQINNAALGAINSGYTFNGKICGQVTLIIANGTWNGYSKYGNPSGTWHATKR